MNSLTVNLHLLFAPQLFVNVIRSWKRVISDLLVHIGAELMVSGILLQATWQAQQDHV